MGAQSIAKRRRRQAKMGYTHTPKNRRPHYVKSSAGPAAARSKK